MPFRREIMREEGSTGAPRSDGGVVVWWLEENAKARRMVA